MRFDKVDAARTDWQAGKRDAASLAAAKWGTQETVRFLRRPARKARCGSGPWTRLDAAFHFNGTANGEIAQRWYPLTVRERLYQGAPGDREIPDRHRPAQAHHADLEALMATPEGLTFAEGVFTKARQGYHPITTGSVQAELDKAKKKN